MKERKLCQARNEKDKTVEISPLSLSLSLSLSLRAIKFCYKRYTVEWNKVMEKETK